MSPKIYMTIRKHLDDFKKWPNIDILTVLCLVT